MKTRFVAITAMLMSSTSMVLADDASIGSVGDLPGFGEDAYFADENGYYQQTEAYTDQDSYTDGSDAPSVLSHGMNDGYVDQVAAVGDQTPIGTDTLQPVQYHDHGAMVGDSCSGGCGPECGGPECGCEASCGCDASFGCDGGCDSGCDSACSLKRKCGIKIFDCNTWATYEALLWFPQPRKLPIMVAGSAAGTLPILGPGGSAVDGVATLFGGDGSASLSGGFRTDYGKWISDKVGIGGRFWWLGENGESYSIFGTQGADQTISLPFNEINPAAPNGQGQSGLLIGFDDGVNLIEGDVAMESTLDMLAAEVYGRFRLGCSSDHSLDLIGGYSYFQVDDKLRAASRTLVGALDPGAPILDAALFPEGTEITFRDSIEAENRFHGGQIGFEMTTTRGCWTARSLTKVHLGNMEQTLTARGRSTNGPTAVPPVPPAQFGIGNFVQGDVDETDNVFAFVPEANFKLAYRFRPNVSLSVGYSFLYFDNVALAGATIDTNADGPLLGSGVVGNGRNLMRMDDSLWVHGIDLGAVIDF